MAGLCVYLTIWMYLYGGDGVDEALKGTAYMFRQCELHTIHREVTATLVSLSHRPG